MVKDRKKTSGQTYASLWSVASNFISRGLTFVFTPIFTRLLSPEEYGVYSLYVSLMGIFTVFLTFEIAGSVMYRGLAKYSGNKDGFLSSALGAVGLLFLVFLTLYTIFQRNINAITGLNTLVTLFLFLQIFINTALGLYFAKKRYEGDYKTVSLINISIGALSPTLSLILIRLGGGGEARIVAPLITSAIITAPIIYLIIKKCPSFFSKEVWKFLFGITVPMLPHYISLSVIAQLDKILIAKRLGEGAVGKYSAAYSVGFVLSLLTNGLLLALSPWTIRKLKEKRHSAVKDALLISTKLICFATLIFLTVLPEIYRFIVAPEYSDAFTVAYPVSLSVIFLFLSSAYSNCLLHYERPYLITKNSIISAILCVVLTILGVRLFGYIGGAYATLASYMLLFLQNGRTLKKMSMGLAVNVKRSLQIILFTITFSVLIYAVRVSLFSRVLLFSSLILLILPELSKYKKVLL